MKRPNELWLCPGDELGPHISEVSSQCDCGNTNLVSLARILDHTPSVSEHPDGLINNLLSLPSIQKI